MKKILWLILIFSLSASFSQTEGQSINQSVSVGEVDLKEISLGACNDPIGFCNITSVDKPR